MQQDTPYLQFDGIAKTFPGVQALEAISFGVQEGSVHALVGENGAGKSTLLKVLSGAHTPTLGSVKICGVPQVFRSTAEALRAGVAVIYQELHLVPEMTVAENLFLGHLPARAGLVDRGRLRRAAEAQLQALGEHIDPAARVGRLPIAQRQMVEIAKALTRGAKIIAFDEPTSSLSDREVTSLFSVIRELRDVGHVILYVSHRLDEILELCDRVTVFRDGRHVETFADMSQVTHDILVNRMVGRDIRDVYGYKPRAHGSPALEIEAVMAPGITEPSSLSVAEGEIVGLFGLVGAGRSELLRAIFGAEPVSGGTVRVKGNPVRIRSPRDAIRAGIMLCPEDRKRDGTIGVRSVMENLNISARRRHTRAGFLVDERWERDNASRMVQRLGIRTPSVGQLIANLSGGNQQKVILARWLAEQVGVMLLDEPTRGIDVGSRSDIYSIMYDLADRGIGVLMASSDLPEVIGVSDRVVVMSEGRIVAQLTRDEATKENVLSAALPVSAPTSA